MKVLLYCVLLMMSCLFATAQKIAAVTFSTTMIFTDSVGKKFNMGQEMKDFYYADSHRQLSIPNGGFGKANTFKRFQKGKFVHHTSLFDFDSAALYSIAFYKTPNKSVFKMKIDETVIWNMLDTSIIVLGYKTKIATKIDKEGTTHRVYYTNELADFKIRSNYYEIPGFVLKYEREAKVLKGSALDIVLATDIDFYEGRIELPNQYPITEFKLGIKN